MHARVLHAVHGAARSATTRRCSRKVLPTYPPFGKRMLQDNGTWLATLKRDNVELVTEPIAAITPRGVRCADGSEYAVDVIVFATGFHANRFLWPMEIVGRGGVTLRERVGRRAARLSRHHRAGLSEPLLPLRTRHQPRARRQHHLPLRVPGPLRDELSRGVAARRLLDAWIAARTSTTPSHARFDARHATMVWSHPGMNSWYKNANGRVMTTSPWRLGRLLALDQRSRSWRTTSCADARRPQAMMRNASILGRGSTRLLIALVLCTLPCRAVASDVGAQSLEEPAQYGVYYDRYEPAFYTGFAPRTARPAPPPTASRPRRPAARRRWCWRDEVLARLCAWICSIATAPTVR